VELLRFKTIWADNFDKMIAAHVPLKTGVSQLLDFLERSKIPMAVATSTKRMAAVGLLQKAAIIDRFVLLVCWDEVSNGKPAPDIYLAAACALGRHPTDCVAFEDSSNGGRASVAAGGLIPFVPAERHVEIRDLLVLA